MEISDKVEDREIILRGTVLSDKELERMGFYDTGKKLDFYYVYHKQIHHSYF